MALAQPLLVPALQRHRVTEPLVGRLVDDDAPPATIADTRIEHPGARQDERLALEDRIGRARCHQLHAQRPERVRHVRGHPPATPTASRSAPARSGASELHARRHRRAQVRPIAPGPSRGRSSARRPWPARGWRPDRPTPRSWSWCHPRWPSACTRSPVATPSMPGRRGEPDAERRLVRRVVVGREQGVGAIGLRGQEEAAVPVRQEAAADGPGALRLSIRRAPPAAAPPPAG